MKWTIFGYEIEVKKTDNKTLAEQGSEARREASWTKIETALTEIEAKGLKFSEYRVQKLAGVSINTVKKYRDEIAEWRKKNSRALF